MRRRLACALGALALGWTSGTAQADPLPSQLTMPVAAQAKEAPKGAAVGTAPVVLNNGACCPDTGCDSGRGGIVGGVGIYWIQPYFESNPAFSVQQAGVIGGVAVTSTVQRDFRHDMDIAPHAWLGVVSDCGLGARVRWFQFDDASDDELFTINAGTNTLVTTAFPLGTGLFLGGFPAVGDTTIVANSELEMTVWDFEITQDIHLTPCLELLVAGGVRYAHISNFYGLRAATTVAGVQTLQGVNSGHNFDGWGPTFALEGRRKIGDGGLALYANTRGAILFGTGQQQAVAFGPGFVNAAEARQGDVLPYGEIEIGAEIGQDLGRTRLVVQTGLVGMVWYGAGNAANVDRGLGANDNANLGFLGLALRAGIDF